MKRPTLYIALASFSLTLAGIFSFKPAKKTKSLMSVYAPGYGYLFGATPQIHWSSMLGHTAFFKTIYGSWATLVTGISMWAGKAYVK